MTQCTVTFTRIGRNRHVRPLTVEVNDPDQLAEEIRVYAWPHLVSEDVTVVVDPSAGTGRIVCGFQPGGTFTFTVDAPDTWAIAPGLVAPGVATGTEGY